METKDPNVRLHEGTHRSLGYAEDFHQIVKERPGIISSTLKLMQKAETEYDPPNTKVGISEMQWNKDKDEWEAISIDGKPLAKPQRHAEFAVSRAVLFRAGEPQVDTLTGLSVTLLGKSNRVFEETDLSDVYDARRIDISSYFEIDLGGNKFFVKKSLATDNSGYHEFRDSIKVREALKGVANLKIVEAQLGYIDDRQSWFVSKWEDLEKVGFFPVATWAIYAMNDYGELPERDVLRQSHKLWEIAEAKIKEIKTRLTEVGMDIEDFGFNLFHNFETGQFFLLDVTSKGENRPLGQRWLEFRE